MKIQTGSQDNELSAEKGRGFIVCQVLFHVDLCAPGCCLVFNKHMQLDNDYYNDF